MALSEEEQYRLQVREKYKQDLGKKGMPKWLKIGLLILGTIFVFNALSTVIALVRDSGKSNSITTVAPSPTSFQSQSITPIIKEDTKETKILQEQKAIAENLTKTALDLIANDRVQEAMNLYNDRWGELTKLRGEILYDKELTDAQKKNIDRALKGEQESITNILSKYQQVYQ